MTYLPHTAFIDPRGGNRGEIRELFAGVLDLVIDHLASAAAGTPSPAIESQPEFGLIPDEPLPIGQILERVSTLIRQPRNLAHPGYIGNLESMPTTMSMIAALLMVATRSNMLAEEMSPFLTRVEPPVMRWFASRFGLGRDSGGGLLAGGTLANLQALTTARNVRLGTHEKGVCSRSRSPVIFASEVAHSSLQKSVMVMGLGTSAVIGVRADENSRMDVDDLRRQVRKSLDSGRQEPFCVVATAGTTITGNIDPLSEIASVAKEFGLWLHADAIYGGALMFSPHYSRRLRGIELADSITLNLHKWLYSGLISSMVLFRDFGQLEKHFRIAAPYMSAGQSVPNLGEYSLQGSRQADIIGLLLSLQHIGCVGFAELVEERMQLGAALRAKLRETGVARFTGEMDTNVTCFRPHPRCARQDLEQLQEALVRNAGVCLTSPAYRGESWLKAVILNPYTTMATVDGLVETFTAHCLSGS